MEYILVDQTRGSDHPCTDSGGKLRTYFRDFIKIDANASVELAGFHSHFDSDGSLYVGKLLSCMLMCLVLHPQ